MDEYPVVIKDNLKVEWINLGEGYSGDWNPDDPSDVNLLRFDVYRYYDDYRSWEMLDDASYCTLMPADTEETVLIEGANAILREVEEHLYDGNYKRALEWLSWMNPNDFKKR